MSKKADAFKQYFKDVPVEADANYSMAALPSDTCSLTAKAVCEEVFQVNPRDPQTDAG